MDRPRMLSCNLCRYRTYGTDFLRRHRRRCRASFAGKPLRLRLTVTPSIGQLIRTHFRRLSAAKSKNAPNPNQMDLGPFSGGIRPQCAKCSLVTYAGGEHSEAACFKHRLKRHSREMQGQGDCETCMDCGFRNVHSAYFLLQHAYHPSQCRVYAELSDAARCPVCHKDCKTAGLLRVHLTKSEAGKKCYTTISGAESLVFACRECGAKLPSETKLRRHLQSTEGCQLMKAGHLERSVLHKALLDFRSCELCSFSTPFPGYMGRHRRRQHSAKLASLRRCDRCPFVSESRLGLARHRLGPRCATPQPTTRPAPNNRAPGEPLFCDRCDEPKKGLDNLARHLRIVDCRRMDGQNRLQELLRCPGCTFATKRADKLAAHLASGVSCGRPEALAKRRSPPIPQGPSAQSLPASPTTPLEAAPQSNRSNSEELRCEHCDYATPRPKDLAKHMSQGTCRRTVHNRQQDPPRPLAEPPKRRCEECFFSTRYRSSILEHIARGACQRLKEKAAEQMRARTMEFGCDAEEDEEEWSEEEAEGMDQQKANQNPASMHQEDDFLAQNLREESKPAEQNEGDVGEEWSEDSEEETMKAPLVPEERIGAQNTFTTPTKAQTLREDAEAGDSDDSKLSADSGSDETAPLTDSSLPVLAGPASPKRWTTLADSGPEGQNLQVGVWSQASGGALTCAGCPLEAASGAEADEHRAEGAPACQRQRARRHAEELGLG